MCVHKYECVRLALKLITDQTTCENTIGCSDVALIASSDFGSTVTDFITRGSNLAFCLQSSATDPTLGCIYSRDVSRLSAGEATQQFADYKPIYVDNRTCSS